jgi:XTP/dITP diphosphohydrolase
LTTLVLATANPDKVVEIGTILGPSVILLPRPESVGEVDETGETLLDNARLKARALADATGMAAVADDTGLEVDALGGAPGVRSSRYAGESVTYADNVAKLLRDLDAVPAPRTARFRTVALVAWEDGTETVVEGVVEGTIADSPRGEGGFGYDPVFLPSEGQGRTFAEMPLREKNLISHRGRAFRLLAEILSEKAD